MSLGSTYFAKDLGLGAAETCVPRTCELALWQFRELGTLEVKYLRAALATDSQSSHGQEGQMTACPG